MTREEHLKFCKKCINREMDMKIGLICNLTNKIANFDKNCESYKEDKSILKTLNDEETLEHDIVLSKLSEKDIENFKSEQNYKDAVLVGLIIGIVGALLWSVITVTTGFQIGYMAIAIGAGVGLSMRYVGKGIDQKFGITGGFIALISCLLGNFFSLVGIIANSESLGYLETLTMLNYSEILPIMSSTFSVMDLVFYGIAAYEGYKFSFRAFTEDEIYKLEKKHIQKS